MFAGPPLSNEQRSRDVVLSLFRQITACSAIAVANFAPTGCRSLDLVHAQVLPNSDLEELVETSDEWIATRTGIRKRHLLQKARQSEPMSRERSHVTITQSRRTQSLACGASYAVALLSCFDRCARGCRLRYMKGERSSARTRLFFRLPFHSLPTICSL